MKGKYSTVKKDYQTLGLSYKRRVQWFYNNYYEDLSRYTIRDMIYETYITNCKCWRHSIYDYNQVTITI